MDSVMSFLAGALFDAQKSFFVLFNVVAATCAFAIANARADVAADQDALIWAGFYDGKITGSMNAYTVEAVRRFQSEAGGRPTGQLTADERAQLYRKAAAPRAEVGFQVVADSPTGMTIGIPTRLASTTNATRWGSNWQAPDDSINIDTLRFVGSPRLEELHKKLGSVNGRVLRYSPLRPDWFVLEGEDRDGRQFYVRADASGNEVRAFSVTYARNIKDLGFRIAIAMAASFAPFSGGGIAATPPPPVSIPAQAAGQPVGDCFNGLGASCPTIALGQ
jgi:hypothetical protein